MLIKLIRRTVFIATLVPAIAFAASSINIDKVQLLPAWMDAAMSEGVFQAYHPDIRWQQRGIRHYRQQRFDAARRAFLEGANYADKASQAMLAQMYWRGEGVEQDPARAYAWMDLAAERGYPVFLVEREKMWRMLDRSDQGRAVQIGSDLYANYGDDIAKPRLVRLLKVGKIRTFTGSHAGYDAGIRVATRRADGSFDLSTTSTASYLHPRFWSPKRYWQTIDNIWHDLPTGEVIVHPPQESRTY